MHRRWNCMKLPLWRKRRYNLYLSIIQTAHSPLWGRHFQIGDPHETSQSTSNSDLLPTLWMACYTVKHTMWSFDLKSITSTCLSLNHSQCWQCAMDDGCPCQFGQPLIWESQYCPCILGKHWWSWIPWSCVAQNMGDLRDILIQEVCLWISCLLCNLQE